MDSRKTHRLHALFLLAVTKPLQVILLLKHLEMASVACGQLNIVVVAIGSSVTGLFDKTSQYGDNAQGSFFLEFIS